MRKDVIEQWAAEASLQFDEWDKRARVLEAEGRLAPASVARAAAEGLRAVWEELRVGG